jgi:UDP-glucuronate 4-epimerase
VTGHVVVTGTAGFIGSHLADGLVAAGHEVVGIDAFTPYYAPAEKRANLVELAGHPCFELVDGDLAELPLDDLLTGAAVVFHQAAQPGVRHSWGADFGLYVRHNIVATQRLLEACARVGVPHLVAASSSSVYGDAPTYPTTESSATRPVSPYGVTKLASEHLCLAYAQPAVCDLTVTTLRYFTVYGPRQRPDMGFRRFLEAAYAGAPITVYGDGQQTRSFCYVDDLIRGLVLLAESDLHEPVNIGNPAEMSLLELAELILELTGSESEIIFEALPVDDPQVRQPDITRARELLGWEPEVDIRDGLARTIEHYRTVLKEPASR